MQASSENEGSMKSIENVLIGQTKQVFNLTRAAFDHMGDSHWWSGVVNNAATGLKRFTAPGTKNKRRRMNKCLLNIFLIIVGVLIKLKYCNRIMHFHIYFSSSKWKHRQRAGKLLYKADIPSILRLSASSSIIFWHY